MRVAVPAEGLDLKNPPEARLSDASLIGGRVPEAENVRTEPAEARRSQLAIGL
jgi:hypothetical protein